LESAVLDEKKLGSESAKTMTSFLHLPREIREQIIEYAIIHRDIRAENHGDLGKRAELQDGFKYFSKTQEAGIRWPLRQATANLSTSPSGLLQTNKLIREETIYIISRLPPASAPELDILLVEEDELWPTWTFIPPTKADRPTKVNVTIRMLGITQKEHSGFEEESDLVSIWRFSSILERLLRCGWSTPMYDSVDEDRTLDNLDMNFITPSFPPGKTVLAEQIPAHWAQSERRNSSDLEKAYMHPYALAMSLANWVSVARQHRNLDQPFMGSKHDLMGLLERIRTMSFRVDGAVRHTEILKKLKS
jgi:hypothetical protein